MIFWFIVLGVSIVGISAFLLLKTLKPEFFIGEDQEEPPLKEVFVNVKDRALITLSKSKKAVESTTSKLYNKSTTALGKTRVSSLVSGRKVLEEKKTNSSFLKDIKETRDKVREEFVEPKDDN